MQHIKRVDFADEVNSKFFIWCIRSFSQFKMTPIYQNQSIHVNFAPENGSKILFLFSECFHLYLRQPTAAKSPLSICCITNSIHIFFMAHKTSWIRSAYCKTNLVKHLTHPPWLSSHSANLSPMYRILFILIVLALCPILWATLIASLVNLNTRANSSRLVFCPSKCCMVS